MNVTTKPILSMIGVALGFVSCFALAFGDSTETLALTIQVLDHAGQPVPGIELIAGHSQGTNEVAAVGVTDAAGQVAISLPRPQAATRLGVIISEGVTEGADWVTRVEAVRTLAQTNAWNAVEWFAVEADAAEKTVTVTLRPAITVRGRLANSPASAGPGFIQQRYGPIPAISKPNRGGAFELHAVARNQDTDVFVFGAAGCVSIVHLTAAQTAQDVDLGDLDASCGVQNSTVHVTFDGSSWPTSLSSSIAPGVTLIRSDGSRIVPCFVRANGEVVSNPASPSPDIRIESGTWYLVPGLFDADEALLLRAFDLVRSGQTALVPNWPTITVAPGETATATVHAAELDAAIRATMPPE